MLLVPWMGLYAKWGSAERTTTATLSVPLSLRRKHEALQGAPALQDILPPAVRLLVSPRDSAHNLVDRTQTEATHSTTDPARLCDPSQWPLSRAPLHLVLPLCFFCSPLSCSLSFMQICKASSLLLSCLQRPLPLLCRDYYFSNFLLNNGKPS